MPFRAEETFPCRTHRAPSPGSPLCCGSVSFPRVWYDLPFVFYRFAHSQGSQRMMLRSCHSMPLSRNIVGTPAVIFYLFFCAMQIIIMPRNLLLYQPIGATATCMLSKIRWRKLQYLQIILFWFRTKIPCSVSSRFELTRFRRVPLHFPLDTAIRRLLKMFGARSSLECQR